MAGGNIGHIMQAKLKGHILSYLVADNVHIYRGSMVAVLTSSGYAVPAADTLNHTFVGFAEEEVDNTLTGHTAGGKSVKVRRWGIFRMAKEGGTVAITEIGGIVCASTAQGSSADQTCEALASSTNKPIVGAVVGVDTTDDYWWVAIWALGIENLTMTSYTTTTDLADHANAAKGSALIGWDDGGSFSIGSVDNVGDALDEIYQHIINAKAHIPLPMGLWQRSAGEVLAKFADGDTETPGYSAVAEAWGIRWNNKASHTGIAVSIPLPDDLDILSNVVLHISAAKIGATAGDATTFTVEAFNNVVGELYDADGDFGGASSAMTGAAATKTVQEVTLTLALANLAAAPAVLQLTLQPTDTTLATDDVIVFAVWLEYTRKMLLA